MHKPLAQALVIIAAAAVASDEPSSGRRLAARRGRRRPVKKETESSHGLKESTPQLGKRAAPDGKTRFMLLSTQRSGTHYVMHELRGIVETSEVRDDRRVHNEVTFLFDAGGASPPAPPSGGGR